ncbi:MAG: hypothetical protein U5K74_15785 [Gemmatimonadaceae bacterium]|nr:hypothetical protein [Gemmatimonadaceae bacterium]
MNFDAAIAFAVFSVFGALMPYSLRESRRCATFVTFLASVVLVPSWVSVLAAAGVILLAQVVQRTGKAKTTFNVAQHAMALSAGVVACKLTGGEGAVYGEKFLRSRSLLSFWRSFLQTLPPLQLLSALRRVPHSSAFGKRTRSAASVWTWSRFHSFMSLLRSTSNSACWRHPPQLRLSSLVRQLNSTNEELHRSNKELLELTVTTLEARDPYTSGHSRQCFAVLQDDGPGIVIVCEAS